MPKVERARELTRRRSRKAKLKKYRAQYAAAKTDAERDEIAAKVRRISPFAVLGEEAEAK
ncbi:MAG: DUF6800 family protein [Planctomycetota bacterium]